MKQLLLSLSGLFFLTLGLWLGKRTTLDDPGFQIAGLLIGTGLVSIYLKGLLKGYGKADWPHDGIYTTIGRSNEHGGHMLLGVYKEVQSTYVGDKQRRISVVWTGTYVYIDSTLKPVPGARLLRFKSRSWTDLSEEGIVEILPRTDSEKLVTIPSNAKMAS